MTRQEKAIAYAKKYRHAKPKPEEVKIGPCSARLFSFTRYMQRRFRSGFYLPEFMEIVRAIQ